MAQCVGGYTRGKPRLLGVHLDDEPKTLPREAFATVIQEERVLLGILEQEGAAPLQVGVNGLRRLRGEGKNSRPAVVALTPNFPLLDIGLIHD
jgi:hypothetical protein